MLSEQKGLSEASKFDEKDILLQIYGEQIKIKIVERKISRISALHLERPLPCCHGT